MEIESLDHLQRLVQSNDTLIASCFSGSSGDADSKKKSDELGVHSLASLLCRVDFNKVSAADLSLPDGAKAGAQGDGRGGGEVAWWLFFSGGKMVRAGWRWTAGMSNVPCAFRFRVQVPEQSAE